MKHFFRVGDRVKIIDIEVMVDRRMCMTDRVGIVRSVEKGYRVAGEPIQYVSVRLAKEGPSQSYLFIDNVLELIGRKATK